MNEIVNKFLLAGDKFMPDMHLRQSGFSYISCRSFPKNKRGIKNLKKQEIQDTIINKRKLDKTCLQNNIFYGDFKDFFIRAASDKVLCDKAFNFAENPKFGGFQRELATAVYERFDKKFSGGAVIQADKSTIKCKIMTNQSPPDLVYVVKI